MLAGVGLQCKKCVFGLYSGPLFSNVCLFELELCGPVNTVKVMSSQSVNIHTIFLGRLNPQNFVCLS